MQDKRRRGPIKKPIDPQEGVLRVAEMVVQMATDDEQVRRDLRAIQDRLAQRFIDERSLNLRRRLFPEREGEERFAEFRDMSRLLPAMHSRTIQLLQGKGFPTVADVQTATTDMVRKLDEVGPDAFGDLMLETESAALRRPLFEQKLADEARAILSMRAEFGALAERAETLFLGETSSPAKCTIGDEEYPCWLVLLVLALLILCRILDCFP